MPTVPAALCVRGGGSPVDVTSLFHDGCPRNFLEQGFQRITRGDGGNFLPLKYCQGQCAFQEIVCEILNIETVIKIEPDRSLPPLFLLNIDKLSSACTSNFQLQILRKGGRHRCSCLWQLNRIRRSGPSLRDREAQRKGAEGKQEEQILALVKYNGTPGDL